MEPCDNSLKFFKKQNSENGLTSMRSAYTLASTPSAEGSEVDIIMITNFLQTLAEVALAVASRKSASHHNSEAN